MRKLIFLFALMLAACATWADGDNLAPDGWRLFVARDEIAPKSWVQKDQSGYSLGLAGRGEASVDGRWLRRLPVKAGQYVAFSADYQAKNIATPPRSIVASVLWFNKDGKQVEQAEFPVGSPMAGEIGRLVGTYRVPAGAAEAQLELRLRWAPDGQILWKNVKLTETEPPAPRKVKIASINHRPRGTSSSQENLEQFAKLIDSARSDKVDIFCLPEGITLCGTRLTYAQAAEPIPGPSTDRLGRAAAQNNAYIVAGIYEREGKAIYNTSVLIGRKGELLGKYRKVCLPREEIDGGITPGTDYPVFDTDFGRVAMMICWDVCYPEVARELSARGAEIILMPIWGGNETLARARAIENQVYVVASGYDFPTVIYDRAGETLARAKENSQVIKTEIDLNERTLWPWLGDWRSRIWREGPARK